MDWKAKLQSARESLDQDSQRKLEENWPKVKELFREKVGPAALAAVQDDRQMTPVLKMVYEALPFPIRLVVKQDAFIQFCLAHRDRLAAPDSGGNPAR